DLASRAVLEDALVEFPGTQVFISHDRYFINRLATKVVEVRDGRLVIHLGGYDDYQAAIEQAPSDPPPPLPTPPPPPLPPPPPPPDRAGRAGAAAPGAAAGRPRAGGARPPGGSRVDPAVRELRRRLDALEAEIHTMEARLADLGRTLADPTLYTDGERARAVT